MDVNVDDDRQAGLQMLLAPAAADQLVSVTFEPVTTVTAEILNENAAMRRIFKKAKPTWTRPDRGILAAVMPTENICALVNDDRRAELSRAVGGIGLAAEVGLRIHG